MGEQLRSVADVTTQGEAEFLKNLLAEEGVPALVRHQGLLTAALQADGPHSVLVKESDLERARQVVYGASSEGLPGE